MTVYRRILLSGAALCLMSGSAGVAAAQPSAAGVAQSTAAPVLGNFNRERSISVRQRRHEGYDALGVPLGAFMAWPKVVATLERNDNIYATATNELEDTVWHVQPDLRLTSTWSRHYLEAFARGSINRYSDFDGENTEDYSIGAIGRIDIERGFSLLGSATSSHNTEPRSAPSSAVTPAAPIEYDVTQGIIGGSKEFNRLKLTARFDAAKYDYEDARSFTGVVLDQDARDRSTRTLTGRADYAISPDTALFVEVAANNRDYDLARPVVDVSRDSDGYSTLVGANFEVSALARGEIAVGYISQSFDDVAFQDIDGFGARLQLEWFPTELTTLTFTGSRSIEDSGTPGNAGSLNSNISATVDHELLRNVILTANVFYGNDDHQGAVPREDKRVGLNLTGTYLLNNNVGVTAGYSYLDQDSSQSAFAFKQNKITAGLTFQF